MAYTYIHNPKCSKSRQGLELIEKKGLKYSIKEYLKDPLTKTELSNLYSLLNKKYSLKEYTRTKEKLFKELGLSVESLSSKEKWVKTVFENPVLIERPILYNEKKAIIGRPPEDLIK